MQNQHQYCPNCRQVIYITDSVCKHCGHIIVKNYENRYQVNSTGDEKTTQLDAGVSSSAHKVTKESGSYKNILAIIGIVLAVVAMIFLIYFAVTKSGKKDKDSKDTTTEITEDTTEDVSVTSEEVAEVTTHSTEEPDVTTENNGDSFIPEGMSDDWKDMQIYIDGDLYQFPMAYTDFMDTGWTVVEGDTQVPGLNDINITVARNGMKCVIAVINYDVLEAPIEEGYVRGIYMNAESVPIGQHEIILPGGITMYASTADDIVAVYDEPELTYFGDDVTQMDYANGGFSLMAEFLVDVETGVLGSIQLFNDQVPGGITYDIGMVSTSAPAFNSSYVAPSGASQDRLDSIVSVDGVNYQLPVPVSVFLDNGWTINPAADDLIPGKGSYDYTLYKGDSEIDVCLYNFTMDAIYPVNAMVVGVRVSDYFCNVDVYLPGGIYFEETTGIEFANVYSDMETSYLTEYDGYSQYYEVDYSNEEGSVYIYASSPTEEAVIDYYYYEYIPDSIE